MTSSAPSASRSLIAAASAASSCGTRRSAMMLAPAGASRSAVTRRVFSITLGASPGRMVETTPDPLDPIGRDPQRAAGGGRHGRIAQARLDPERNDLDGRDHLALDHRLESGERREGDGLVDAVDAVDRGAVDHQHAGTGGKQVGAAGEGAVDVNALARNRLRDAGGGLVLADVARLRAARRRRP